MSLLSDLQTHITTEGTLTALFGTRLYGGIAAQGTVRPFVTWTEISQLPEQTHDGLETLEYSRIQYDIYTDMADSALTGLTIAIALQDFLVGTSATVGSTKIGNIIWLDRTGPTAEPEEKLWRYTVEVGVWHQQ